MWVFCGNKCSLWGVCHALEHYDLPCRRLNVKVTRQSECLLQNVLPASKATSLTRFCSLMKLMLTISHLRARTDAVRWCRNALVCAGHSLQIVRFLPRNDTGCETVELAAGKGVDGARFLQWAPDLNPTKKGFSGGLQS